MKILLGYELGSGRAVEIPLTHLAVTGQTQASGKTTTLEALISRSGLRAVAFVTKRGEASFTTARVIPPYFRERADWQFVKSLLESQSRSRMNFEAAWIIRACKGARSLSDVQRAVQETMRSSKRALDQNVCEVLNAYFDVVLPQVARLPYTKTLDLAGVGIHVMNLTDYSTELQALVIRSVLEWVYEREENTVVIIPEAWEFIPQKHGSPVMHAAIALSRKGGALENFVWLDSQDIAGVNKEMLRAPQVWILGVQREINEVKRTLAHIPIDSPKPKPGDVMQLGKGEFFVCFGRELRKVYVQPAWLPPEDAQAIAKGAVPKSFASLRRFVDKTESPRQGELSAKEDAMWKEKYEELQEEHRNLVAAHDSLAARVKELQDSLSRANAFLEKQKASSEASTALASRGRTAGAATPGPSAPAASPNGSVDLDAVYAYVKQRAAEDPGILELLRLQPELKVTVQRRTLAVSDTETDGRIALLIHDGFFDVPQNTGSVAKEFKRRGWFQAKTSNAAVLKPLFRIAGMGFLVKEATGYQAVSGMKVRVHEDAHPE